MTQTEILAGGGEIKSKKRQGGREQGLEAGTVETIRKRTLRRVQGYLDHVGFKSLVCAGQWMPSLIHHSQAKTVKL